MEKLTFDQMPEAMEIILEKLVNIEKALALKNNKSEYTSEIMNVEEACNFLKMTKSTIYTKVSRGELPSYKSGKRLVFNRTELKEHINLYQKPSNYQSQKEAELHVRLPFKTKRHIY